ncbi:hypothetical protein [Microbacterium lacticum]
MISVGGRSAQDDVDASDDTLDGRQETGGRGAGRDRTNETKRLNTPIDRAPRARHDPYDALPLIRDAHDRWR